MKEFIDKLSSYNLFNYLFPGVVFVVLLKKITAYDYLQENVLLGAFVYYLIGLFISRFGSLVIKKILIKIRFIKDIAYSEYVKSSKVDSKTELLSETNNMYRTLCSLFVLLLLFKAYEVGSIFFKVPKDLDWIILITVLLIVFLFSYRKQTQYVVARIEANKTQTIFK